MQPITVMFSYVLRLRVTVTPVQCFSPSQVSNVPKKFSLQKNINLIYQHGCKPKESSLATIIIQLVLNMYTILYDMYSFKMY